MLASKQLFYTHTWGYLFEYIMRIHNKQRNSVFLVKCQVVDILVHTGYQEKTPQDIFQASIDLDL